MPVAPISLWLDLEARGCRLWRDGDALVVEPAHLVSDTDRRAIRQWKLHLLALVDYQPPDVQ